MAFVPALLGSLGSAIGGAAGSVGTLLGAGSSILGGISGMQASRYQAAVADANAKVAEANAQRATQQSQAAAQQQDDATAALLGEQMAAQSASGLSLGGRSQIMTRKRAKQLGRQDTLNIREQGDYEVQGFRQESANQTASAGMARASGMSSLIGGFLGGASSLIGGATTVKSPNRITGRRDPWNGYRSAMA